MAAVRTLADGRIKLTILTTPPEDINAITVAELTAGIEASCAVAKNGTRFSATASDTISDPRLCDEGNSNAMGPSNYEGAIVPFLLFDDETNVYSLEDNVVYEAARAKGTNLTYVLREGPEAAVEWAAGDRYDAYEAISDNPQRPSETSGYIKRTIPLQVQRAALDKAVAGL